MADQPDAPTLQFTPEMAREAKQNPGGWVYVISGKYGPNDAVPPEAIVGAWKVDENGDIIPGSFQPNPNYKQVAQTALWDSDLGDDTNVQAAI